MNDTTARRTRLLSAVEPTRSHPTASDDRTAPDEPAPGFSTEQVHGAHLPDAAFGARVPPIYLTAGFVFDDFDDAASRFSPDGPADGYSYSRIGNPTNAEVERRLAALERGTGAVLVGSGQAAVAVALLGILGAGDHLVASGSVYEGSRELFRENFARLGIEVSFVADPLDVAQWQSAVRPTTRALFAESVSNPRTHVLDIPAVAAVAHAAGAPLVVDNTLATPYLLRPLELGADVVVHSASKLLSGHGTCLAGVIVAGAAFDWSVSTDGRPHFPHLTEPTVALAGQTWVQAHGPGAYLGYTRTVVATRLGPVLSPFNAFLLRQGLETLSLRVDRYSRSALALAAWLEGRPEVASVDYPGLASSTSAAVARRDMPRGAGAVFSFTLTGGQPAARAFVDAVRLFSRMAHLGDVRSLVVHPATTTHAHRDPGELAAAGITPGLLRLSIGIEDIEDLVRDLDRGLRAITALPTVAAVPGVTHRLAEAVS